jgi:hypothetical protein
VVLEVQENKRRNIMVEEIKYEVEWSPKEDITVYELAKCIPYIFSKLHSVEEWDKLNDDIKRHFISKEYEYGKMIRETQSKLKDVIDKFEGLFDEE